MPFTIEQTSLLELKDKNGEIIEVPQEALKEVGKHDAISSPQFKEDDEERLVKFEGKIEQGTIKVEVTYSIGLNGHAVQDVKVVEIPKGLEIETIPNFETQECDDE